MPHALLTAALILGASAGSASATEVATFDLVCTGQTIEAGGAAKPFASRISLDLKSKRWCDRTAGCPYILPIRTRRADALQLLAVKTPYNEAAFDVDLKTGAFTRSTRIPDRADSPTAAKGTCTPAPFTPFS